MESVLLWLYMCVDVWGIYHCLVCMHVYSLQKCFHFTLVNKHTDNNTNKQQMESNEQEKDSYTNETGSALYIATKKIYVCTQSGTHRNNSLFCTIHLIPNQVTLYFLSLSLMSLLHFPHNVIIIVFELASYALMRRVLNKTCYCQLHLDKTREFEWVWVSDVTVGQYYVYVYTNVHVCLFSFPIFHYFVFWYVFGQCVNDNISIQQLFCCCYNIESRHIISYIPINGVIIDQLSENVHRRAWDCLKATSI